MLGLMLAITVTDVIGYAGTALVLLSFLMSNMRDLRLVSILGCTCFIIYGILIDFAIPIIITNVSIILINVFALLRKKKEEQ